MENEGMRRGMSLSGLSGQESECKSPFLRLSYWTGSTPYQVTHLKLKMLGSEKEEERRHCSLLCNQKRVAPFFCPHHPMWANELRGAKWVSGPTGGHTRISAHKSTLPARDALC